MLTRRIAAFLAMLCMVGASFAAHANGAALPEIGTKSAARVTQIGTSAAAVNPLPPLFDTLEERTFPHAQRLDGQGLADRVGSVSFIAALPSSERTLLLGRARALAGGGEVELPYWCEVSVCFRRA